MKAIILASALAFCSTAAIAQDMPTPPPPPAPGAQPMQDGMTPPPAPGARSVQDGMTPPPPPAPVAQPMQDGMTPPPPPAPGAQPMGQPMNQPMAQGGQVGGVQFAPMQTTPPPAAKADYPVCSRTVTDGCRQPRG